MSNIEKLSDGTVAEAEKALPSLSREELAALRDVEEAGKKRKTLLDAIDAELADRPAPARDAGLQAAFDKGRHARKNGIGRDESPLSKGAARDAWADGWDFQDAI